MMKKAPYTSYPVEKISGELRAPGDKSISHRALLLGLLAEGETKIRGLLTAADVQNTKKAIESLGAVCEETENGVSVFGVGLGALPTPKSPLDFGNSGTGARLMMGIIAGHGISATFTGDESLSKRPMARILHPLMDMGAKVTYHADEGRLPLTVTGRVNPLPLTITPTVPSAQLKSAVLLCGLTSRGTTRVIESHKTRNHSETMLKAFGADIVTTESNGVYTVEIKGGATLKAQDVDVPADPSSAAFLVVAALITKNGNVRVKDVLLSDERTGLFKTLQEMGANISIENERTSGGEPLGDIVAKASSLKGCIVPKERAPSMIDEYPIAAIAAAFALGETRFCGLSELRVKESDRLDAVYQGLTRNGVKAKIEGDDLIVSGGGIKGGGTVETHHDHRIAMAFLVAGMAAENAITVDDVRMIETSFPNFIEVFTSLGANLKAET